MILDVNIPLYIVYCIKDGVLPSSHENKSNFLFRLFQLKIIHIYLSKYFSSFYFIIYEFHHPLYYFNYLNGFWKLDLEMSSGPGRAGPSEARRDLSPARPRPMSVAGWAGPGFWFIEWAQPKPGPSWYVGWAGLGRAKLNIFIVVMSPKHTHKQKLYTYILYYSLIYNYHMHN